jgi:MFS family permease
MGYEVDDAAAPGHGAGREPAAPDAPRPHGLRERLGLRRNILVMLALVLIVGSGEELWVRFVPEYLLALGGAVWAVAAYRTLFNLLDAVYQYPGGWLADHLGRWRALMLFTLLAAMGYGVYLIAPSWEWVVLGTLLVMAWDTLTQPAVFAIIGDNLPRERRATGFGFQSMLRRVPMVVAPPLGGLLIGALGVIGGVRLGLGVTIALCLVAAGVVWWFYDTGTGRAPPVSPVAPVGLVTMWRGMDGRLKRLLVADILSRWAEGIAAGFVLLYVVNEVGLSYVEFGLLITVQRVTNIVLYVPLAALSDRMNRKPFVLLTFAFFALFPLVLVNVVGFWGAVVAFVVAGLWEVGEPARKALIVDLAHAEARGRAVGIYYLARNLAVFPAALVGGLLWDGLGPAAVFYAAFAVGAVAFVVYAAWGEGDGDRVAAAGVLLPIARIR